MEIGKLNDIFMVHIKKISTISINGISNEFEGVFRGIGLEDG
jgi:hypothetical protein